MAGIKTKGEYVERFFLNEATRRPEALPYVPKRKADYAGVAKRLAAKGEKVLLGSKPGDTLVRSDFIVLSYLLAGGSPGTSLGEKIENGRRLPHNIGVYGKFRLKGLRMLGDGGGQKVVSHFGVVRFCGGK